MTSFDRFDREIEEIVNIFREPDEGEEIGHTSIFRVYNPEHKEDLTSPSGKAEGRRQKAEGLK